MKHSTSSTLFQIRIQDDALIMHGSQTESVGCVLRGQLILSVTEPTKFKEINLQFQGKSKIKCEGNGLYPRYKGRILYQHNWNFLPAKDEYHVLEPDNYQWDFELILPGHLPETIEGCKRGSVKYMLRATAGRHSFATNLQTQRKVTLQRILLPTSLEYFQSAVTINTKNKIEYEFSASSLAFSLGDKISTMINLKSLDYDFEVLSVSCALKEKITYMVGIKQKTDSRAIICVKEEISSKPSGSWSHRMELQMPDSLLDCAYDSQNDLIHISHDLEFHVEFKKQKLMFKRELKAEFPVIITSMSPSSDNMNLPAYNENNLDNFYLGDNLSTFSASTCSFESDLQEFGLPPYRSISHFAPSPLSDSLLPPTYDATIY